MSIEKFEELKGDFSNLELVEVVVYSPQLGQNVVITKQQFEALGSESRILIFGHELVRDCLRLIYEFSQNGEVKKTG